MTRMLSDLLGAPQPGFSHRIKQLERASGEPGTDIRLSADIIQRTKAKIQELGLDPQDTTSEELYIVLQQRLLADEQRLRDYMGLAPDADAATVIAGVLKFEKKLQVPRSCFALRSSVAKRLLKHQPPKKAMSKLGYRSVDSMIKHELVANIYSACLAYEPSSWHQAYLHQYDQLNPSDFETRDVTVQYPRAHRWETLAEHFETDYHHGNAVFKELGAIVVLPIQSPLPGLAITSLLSILDGLNTIRCASTYLKLQQVGANFGALVRQVNLGEPTTGADFAGQPLPWRIIQRYYHAVKDAYHPALFEPHVQPEDLRMAEAETALSETIPALAFWEDTASLAHVENGRVVSLNMLDVALGVANELAIEQGITKHVRQNVWSDVITGYLRHQGIDYLLEKIGSQHDAPAELEQGVLA